MRRDCKMRRLTFIAAAFAATLSIVASASAQVYPSRPITIIVPFPPGGPVDIIARIMADRMRASFGQPVIIENQAGASGSIGVGRAVRAMPDGYTLNLGNWTSHVGSPAIYPIAYDIVKDLEPVALLPIGPTLIVGKKALPASDLKELVVAKGQPRQGDGRHRRHRQPIARQRHLFPKRDRHPLPVRAVPRRCPAHPGPGRRPDRHANWGGGVADAVVSAQRRDQGLRGLG